jgi:lysophosphatidylcholine acyltransferase/lyso-PAF acetyltransferase
MPATSEFTAAELFCVLPVEKRPAWHYVLLVPFWIVVVPVRSVLVILTLLWLWLWLKVLTIGAHVPTKPGDPSFGKVRAWLIDVLVRYTLRFLLLVMGIWVTRRYAGVRPTQRGVDPTDIKSGLMVGNHIGLVDALSLTSIYGCSPMAKKQIRSVAFVGVLGDALQTLWIERGQAEDRMRAKEMVLERIQRPECRPVLVFPEGTNGNGRAVLQFRKGLFEGGLPVRPVAISCPHRYFDLCQVDHRPKQHFFLILCGVYHRLFIDVLDEHQPSDEEKADAALFAGNVQAEIAHQLQVPCSRLGMRDNPWLAEYFAKQAARQARASVVVDDEEAKEERPRPDQYHYQTAPMPRAVLDEEQIDLVVPLAEPTSPA